jgi:transposase InsO family protein
MAEVLDMTPAALSRWMTRQAVEPPAGSKLGRPEVIPPEVKKKIRACYLEHYKQWGPCVLSIWAEREGHGKYCPSTISKVIEDLKEKPEDPQVKVRYEITAPGVLWSEDGTGFKDRGKKKELLALQDECSRFKLNHLLAPGPANAKHVYGYLKEAFEKYGPPLIIKHDGDKIFHEEDVVKLLKKYDVVALTSPPHYPQYNGKKERSFRDIKGFERSMRRMSSGTTLAQRIDAAVNDLNYCRPRPVLGKRTAWEVYSDRKDLPDRKKFKNEVKRAEKRLLKEARSRKEEADAVGSTSRCPVFLTRDMSGCSL